MQVWAQAVEKAGTVEAKAVAAALRTQEFDTILGTIGFDDKGDVYGYEPFVWYVWQEGNYAPARPGQAGRLRFESARRGLGQEQIGEQQERAVAMPVTETYQRRC